VAVFVFQGDLQRRIRRRIPGMVFGIGYTYNNLSGESVTLKDDKGEAKKEEEP
jgi:hypothetical protein